MIIHDVEQGSPEWLALRDDYLTASDAPTMMDSGYNSRDQAIRYKLGIDKREITPTLQALFDAGHEQEEKARQDLTISVLPLVCSLDIDGLPLMASFDGITEDHDLVWEHKYTSKVFDDIPPLYFWQLEHQLLVADTDAAILTITSRNDLSVRHFDYKSNSDRRAQLIEGWHKWLKDLENYERSDSEFIEAATLYKTNKQVIDKLTAENKKLGSQLHKLAGKHSARGGGILVSVSRQLEQKQSPAAYIKEHNIVLPATKLDEPKTNYRITITK